MGRQDENTFLGRVALPFDRLDRVPPYDNYLRTIIPGYNVTPTLREWQSGVATLVAPGAAVVLVLLDVVPPGFQDTYLDYTVTVASGTNEGWTLFRDVPSVTGAEIRLGQHSIQTGQGFNFLRAGAWGDTSLPNQATDRNVVLGPGQRLRSRSTSVVAVGVNITVMFTRWREPGPTVRQDEDVSGEIAFS